MSSSYPTIVLGHGGMYDDSCLAPLIASLNTRPYPTVTGPLPTVSSPTPKSVDLSTDVDYVRSTSIKPLLEEGEDVVIAMHSYGGIARGFAVQGLSKTERAKGRQERRSPGADLASGLGLPVGVRPIDGLSGSWDDMLHVSHDVWSP